MLAHGGEKFHFFEYKKKFIVFYRVRDQVKELLSGFGAEFKNL